METNNTFLMASGIDSLYFHYESSLDYDDLFLDIVDQVEDKKAQFSRREIKYHPNDIVIKLRDVSFSYLGFSEGYYWFRDVNEFFKIGFKDKLKMRHLHDIRVQLQGQGIYSIGIHSLITYIDSILEGYITDEKPIIRCDLNAFVQFDFSFVDRSMFVTRKRNYATISEIGDANTIQTLYIGKPPFRLRLYNKSLEMQKSKKEDLMREYLGNQGFDLDAPIFNLEFEMHRAHLKSYGLKTIEDVLSNAKNLFQSAMNDIRLIDQSSISATDIQHNNKHRATTLPIWDSIKERYDIEEFLQIQAPLERIKRKAYVFDQTHFMEEYMILLRKGLINAIPLTKEVLLKGLDDAVMGLERPMRPSSKPYYYPADFTPLEITHFNGTKEHFRLLRNGELIQPVNVLSVDKLSDYDLLNYLEDVAEDFKKEDIDFKITNKRYQIAYNEAVRRKLKIEIPF